MRIGAIVRIVPDLVMGIVIEESEIVPFKYVPNERDEHALEEAVVFKEKTGGNLEVVGIVDDELRDDEAMEEALALAYAKGADSLKKIVLNRRTFDRREVARAIADHFKDYDVVMVGIQSIDSFAGYLGGILSGVLGYSYVGGVVGVDYDGGLIVQKELGGGVVGKFRVKTPAILGVVSAERPITFVPLVKLRQAMKEMKVEEIEVEVPDMGGIEVVRFYEPEKPEITLLEGDVEELADKLVEVFKSLSLV